MVRSMSRNPTGLVLSSDLYCIPGHEVSSSLVNSLSLKLIHEIPRKTVTGKWQGVMRILTFPKQQIKGAANQE